MSDIEASRLYDKCLGALAGGVIGDALGAPTEGKSPDEIECRFGWVDDFASGGTDDTILRDILAATLIRTSGYATIDDWADDWLARWDEIFGPKQNRFFLSVLHTARRLRVQGEPRLAALGNIPCSSSAMCIAPVGLVNACNPAQAAAQATHLASLINVQDAGFCQDGRSHHRRRRRVPPAAPMPPWSRSCRRRWPTFPPPAALACWPAWNRRSAQPAAATTPPFAATCTSARSASSNCARPTPWRPCPSRWRCFRWQPATRNGA